MTLNRPMAKTATTPFSFKPKGNLLVFIKFDFRGDGLTNELYNAAKNVPEISVYSGYLVHACQNE
jgi:hypothetical protein